MLALSTPDSISSQHLRSRTDSTALSSRVMSGLLEIPGSLASFLRFDSTDLTSQVRDNLTSRGQCLDRVSILGQLRVLWGPLLAFLNVSTLLNLTSGPWLGNEGL